MGDAQSAQRENKKDAAAEEESGQVDDARAEQNTEEKPLKNNGQISEINGKADSTIAEVNGHCEDEIAAEAILSPEDDVLETAKPLKEEETPLETVEINQKESPNEAEENEEGPLEITEMDAKQNDINEGFRRFFSNIGLKLTVKRGSAEKADLAEDVPDETNEEETNRPEYIEGTTNENKSENTEQNTDLTTAKETYDNDSTTCPTMTDATSEDVLENAEEKTTEAKEEVESDHVDEATTSPEHEDEKAKQDTTPEEDLHPTSPSSPETEVVSPIKRFFTTGIFSGLRKKKKPTEDETTDKELVEMGKDTVETAEKTSETEQDKEEVSVAVEAETVEMNDGKSPSTDEIVNEPEITSSQEKVQASPLKRLLSGSKKRSKKQKGRKSGDAKLSDSGEHFSDQVISSTESAEHQKVESPAPPTAEPAGEEDSAWASFKKLVTPKKRTKANEETQIQVTAEETKPSEEEHISDRSTEEGKKRKDSSVSWEAVLCGSGRRRSRSRKTSDSEDEMPQAENKKQDSPLESSNEADEIVANSPQQEGSPSEGDGGSTWKSLKKLVTPKRKAKDEEETKDNIQSDSEVPQDDSSFSIKKLIPGRKKRKSAEKQDQVSSDEADREVVSGDEDSETPAVVPLSEFDTTETEVQIKTQADIESHVSKDADDELQQDLLDQMAEAVPPCDSLQTEAKKAQDYEDTVENEAAPIAASDEEPEDLTESISKHQQLSDIPEEGIITDTMATPASVTEEAARDDTIAEDLIEITSEAITAPEPVDITMTDETEMISAVSQLSESSKTSGNTTPVPVEYDVKHTDELLHQVVETISVSPAAAPLCSEDVSSERIVGSVSPQILESFVKEQPAILEIHKRSDATAITIGLNVEELEVIDELAATAQTESISEVNEGVSTEIVSEVLTMQIDTAEAGVDEVHEVSVSHPEESIKELERPVEVESQSEVNEDVSTETVTEGEETVADEDSLVGAHQDEKEPTQVDSQEAEPASTVAGESEDGGVEQEIEDKDQAPVEMEEIAAVQAPKSEEDVIPEDVPAAEIEAQKTQEEIEPVTQDNVEVEREDELQADAATTEPADVPEVLEEVVPTTIDSEDGRAPSPQGEALSEDIPTVESVIDEIIHETENLSVELKSDTIDTHQNVAEEVLQAVQEPTLELEEGTVQSPEKDIISEVTPEATPEVTPAAETVSDELKEESEPLAEDNEPVDAIENEQVQEPEATQEAKLDSEEGSAISPEKEVISEEIPPTETVEVTQVPESSVELEGEPSVEDAKVDHVQESEEITSDGSIAPEAEAEVEASLSADVVTESVGEGSAQEGQILSEDVSQQETVTSETESKVEEVGQALEINDQKAESIAQSAQAAQEDHVTEVVDELDTLSAVHVSSIDEGECIVQVGEKTLISEVMPDTCVDNAVVTQEPEHEVHASAAVASVEGDKEGELPGVEIQTAPVEHALVTQVITCYLKDVSSALPDVLIEKSSDSHEPLIDTIANEQELEETVITTTPLVKDEVFEKAEEGSVVMMMSVPSVQFEDNHRIQVQVVDVDIKSVETIVDTVLEVGVTETKEVIDVCHETAEEADTQYATSKTEELINQESKVTTEEPVQLVKEKLSEPVPESVPVNLEQTEVSEIVEQQVSEDLQQTPDVPGSVDVSVQEHKEDLEEPKAELEKSEAVVKTEEVKLPSEELHMKTNEEAQIAQIAQSQIATPSNTALVVPQNTGIVSSIGNVESPSSLSLEFKLNIQFGQTRAPASPPPPPPPPPPVTERIEPVKKAEVSEVGVQAVEPEKKIIPAQSPESQKQSESSEVTVQATEITEPVPADISSPKRAVVINQPVLLDVGRQAMERVEPAEQIKPTEEVPPDVQATETIQTVKQTEKQEEVSSQPVLSEACEEETEAKEPVKQTEEENDQDVWLDAEEDIYTQTQVPLPEVEELQEQQPESDQEIKAEPQQESEVAPNSKTEEEESQQEPLKTGATYEIESESEDFAVALEQPEAATATTTITPTEWD